MNPGTFYLYEYENKQRRRNVGFIKAKNYFQSCILQINARGIPAGNGTQLKLYAFFRDDDNLHMTGTQIGTLTCFRRNISMRFTVNESAFPEQRSLAEIDGFLIQMPSDRSSVFWMASEFFFDADLSLLHSPISERENTPPEISESTNPEKHEIIAAENEPSDNPGNDNFASTSPSPDLPGKAQKIQRQDISKLQKKFWPLANNSFLLHGYRSYGHLALIKEEGRIWLGVPGIFDTREARAADLFGFPRFTSSYTSVLNLDENECSTDKNFGHWCRCVGICSSSQGISPDSQISDQESYPDL